MNSLADYEPGDLLELVRQEGSINKTYKVAVTNINFGENGLVTIWGDKLGATAFDPTLIGVKTRFQYIVSVKKLNHVNQSYRPPWSGMSHKDAMRYYGVG